MTVQPSRYAPMAEFVGPVAEPAATPKPGMKRAANESQKAPYDVKAVGAKGVAGAELPHAGERTGRCRRRRRPDR